MSEAKRIYGRRLTPESLAKQQAIRARLIELAAPQMLDALRNSQAVLASLISPDAIQQTTVINAYAQIVEAEAKARSAIAKAVGR